MAASRSTSSRAASSAASSSSWRTETLTNLLDGGVETTARRRYVRGLVDADPLLRLGSLPKYGASHTQQYDHALAQMLAQRRLIAKHGLSTTRLGDLRWLRATVGNDLAGDLHDYAFLPVLRSQCDDEQKARWVPAAESYEMIGCYGQTELGHGSNVRGIETTATLDTATDELVIHSPTMSAAKWWPGGLGHTATHALIFAQLYAGGKHHGVQPFLVQLRSLVDHTPLAGIELGDIGPKMGFQGNDNGYALFNHVRIPRRNMLMGHARLQRDGTLLPAPHAKLAYGSMVFLRTAITVSAARMLAKGVTIAYKYTTRRCQFDAAPSAHADVAAAAASGTVSSALITSTSSGSDKGEAPVIVYPMVHRRLLPLLALSYGMHFAGTRMMALLQAYETDAARGEFASGSLAELHATAAGMKALATTMAGAGLDTCRLLCGGHGYSEHSALPGLWANYVAVCTAEGDNGIMPLQTARFLLKWYQKLAMGGSSDDDAAAGAAVPSGIAYLDEHVRALATGAAPATCTAQNVEDWLKLPVRTPGATSARPGTRAAVDPFLAAARFGAASAIAYAADAVSRALEVAASSGAATDPTTAAFAACEWECHQAALAHSWAWLLEAMAGGVGTCAAIHPALGRTMARCYQLVAAWVLVDAAGGGPTHGALPCTGGALVAAGFLNPGQLGHVRACMPVLLAEVQADAGQLVDAFDLCHRELGHSTLAVPGTIGDVYAAIYEATKTEPINTAAAANRGAHPTAARFAADCRRLAAQTRAEQSGSSAGAGMQQPRL